MMGLCIELLCQRSICRLVSVALNVTVLYRKEENSFSMLVKLPPVFYQQKVSGKAENRLNHSA
jgi:hypothetical protein